MTAGAASEPRSRGGGHEDSRPAPTAVVALRGITKRYGSVVACDDVTFELEVGEIRGLLGQNGAGKSTLMKILIGLVAPDAGSIYIRGEHVAITEPAVATALGIGMVHQHFSLVEPLRVWENVVLADRGRVDPAAAMREVEEVGRRYGLEVDPTRVVGDLTTGQRQRVELIKALRTEPRVLVLDEPTSVLSLAESRELFEVLRRVVHEAERSVVLISHKLEEVLHATDRVTIMRDGAVVATMTTAETTAPALARLMVGREVSLRSEGFALGELVDAPVPAAPAPAAHGADGPATAAVPTGAPASEPGAAVALRIRDAHATGADGRVLLDGLSLEVRAGEILGLAGVEGNGQTTVANLLASLVELAAGSVEIDGRPVPTGRPGAMLRAGVGVIPEDRHRSGCILDMTVAENLVIGDLAAVTRRRLLDRRRLRARAEDLIRTFGIVTPSPEQPMWALSGGNQQRLVLARELSRRPRVLVAAQPSRGLDVGAIEWVAQRVRDAAAEGIAVLLISSELEEILALSDRVAVIHRGRITGVMERDAVDPERLGLLMGGHAA
jgi:simple sugar transport system ATP-binding protein